MEINILDDPIRFTKGQYDYVGLLFFFFKILRQFESLLTLQVQNLRTAKPNAIL